VGWNRAAMSFKAGFKVVKVVARLLRTIPEARHTCLSQNVFAMGGYTGSISKCEFHGAGILSCLYTRVSWAAKWTSQR
jgi:hypothetical protein